MRIIALLFLLAGVCQVSTAQNQAYVDYINRYQSLAVEEMQRTGMPASIKLAQGLIESNAGRSELATKAYNHFGIKCGSGWSGGTYHKKDDDYDSKGRLVKSCFRKFKSAEDSYIAQSEFLRDPNKSYRYGFLFRLNPTDYHGWAYGLLKAGYATNPRYAELLIKVIEDYKLYQYDRPVSDLDWVMEEAFEPQTFSVNDVKYVLVEKGDSPRSLAMDFGVSAKKILKYNENLYAETQDLRPGSRVFIQAKRVAYRGKNKYHYVQAGETMFAISQEYGLRLDRLYKRNKMEERTEPAIGERVKLRGLSVKERPVLRTEKDSTLPKAPSQPLNKDSEISVDISEELLENSELRSEPRDEGITYPEDMQMDRDENHPRYYTVQKGDSLYKIATKFNMTVEKLIELNNLPDSVIHPGQALKISE